MNANQELAQDLRVHFGYVDMRDRLVALSRVSDPLGRRLLKIAVRNADQGHLATARWLIGKALERVQR